MKLIFTVFIGILTLSFFNALLRAEEGDARPQPSPSASSEVRVPTVMTTPVPKPKPQEIMLGRIFGRVEILRSGQFKKVGAETFLMPGDEVWVKKDASASVWIEKSVVDLGKNSVLKLEGRNRFRLLYGSMRGLVPKNEKNSFVFKTANAEVRSPKGEFYLQAMKNKEVFEKSTAGQEAEIPGPSSVLKHLYKNHEFVSQAVSLSGEAQVITKKGRLQHIYRGEYLRIIGDTTDNFPKKIGVGEAKALADRYGIVVTH